MGKRKALESVFGVRGKGKPRDWYKPWAMTLFLVGKREFPISVDISRRFMWKGAATHVHVGYITEDQGERRSVAMLSNSYASDGSRQVDMTFHQRVTGFKQEIATTSFEGEYQSQGAIYAMCLILSRLTGEVDFAGMIVDYPSMNIYSASGIKKYTASVYIMSKDSL